MGIQIQESTAAVEPQKQSNKSTHFKSKPPTTPDLFANKEKIDQLKAKISAVSSSTSLHGKSI